MGDLLKEDGKKSIPPAGRWTIPVPDELEPNCSLCLREKTDPRVMDCLHVFCLECIIGCRVIAGTYECRICKECTFLPYDDLKNNLPVDLGLANFMERKRFNEGLAHCVVCSKGQLTLEAYCVVCQGFLCHDCTTGHFNTKCKDHFYSIEEYFRQDLCKLKQLVCSTHGSFRSYFCDKCNTSKCPNCIADGCQPAAGHRYDKLENVCKEMRVAVDSFQGKIREAPSMRKNIDAQKTHLQKEYLTSVKEIDAIAEYTIELVKKQAKRLKKDAKIVYASQEQRIENDLKEITNLESTADRVIKFQDKFDRYASASQAVMFKQMIDRQLISLQRIDFTSAAPSQYGVRVVGFVPQNLTAAVQNTMGYVETGKHAQLGNSSSVSDVLNLSKLEPPKLMSLSQPAVGPFIGTRRKTPGTGDRGGDIFSTADMFVSDTNPSPSRGLLKSALVERKTILCCAKLSELGTHFAKFKEPSGVAVNNEGDIFVADANSHIIQVFGEDGAYKRHIGGYGENDGQLMYPNQVAICPKSGHVVITERAPNNQVQVFTQRGRFVRKFGQGTVQNPRGVTVDNRGRIIVIESNKQKRVIIFDENGKRLKMFGDSVHLQFPNGVVVNDREEIFISDNLLHCVQVFSYNGSHLRSIGGESITNYPIGICMSSSGDLWVADNHLNFNVTVFNQNGDMVAAYENRKIHTKCLDAALSKDDGSIIVASQDRCVQVSRVGNGRKRGLMGNGASGGLAGNESNATQMNGPDTLGTRIWWENPQ